MGILSKGISATKPITSNLRTDTYMANTEKSKQGSLSEATRTWIREHADSDFKPPQTSTAMGIRGSADSKLSNPGKIDESKWAKAEDLTKKEYGTDEGKWGVVSTIYKSLGGKFTKSK